MKTITLPTRSAASVACGYLLDALRADGCYDQQLLTGLPMPAIVVPEHALLIATTPAPAPLFRMALERVAQARRLDALLLRVAEPELGGGPVTIDAVLGQPPCAPWLIADLQLWDGGGDADLWLVPDGPGPALSVGLHGVTLELDRPDLAPGAHRGGIVRAARHMARLLVEEIR